MSQPISTLMQHGVSCVGLDDTIEVVEKTMSARQLSWVPVLDPQGQAVGVISAVDLLRFHADKRDVASVRAWQLCSYRPIAVSPDAPVALVARLMAENDVHHVVVTAGDTIVGVVSSMDFVRTFI